ncbi:MAG: 30S ribosomal protein S4 [Gemmatimonadaceae bacterium]
MRYTGPSCRQCRREGTKLFLKGTKCFTEKCPVERRPYAPGAHGPQGTTRRRKVSEYAKQLREKQKIKRIYGVTERQFRNTFEKVSTLPGITGHNLLAALESRLDNMVYRMGFAASRKAARQLIRHRHVEVNGKSVDIPSYLVQPGQEIRMRQQSRELVIVKDALEIAARGATPTWLAVDKDTFSGRMLEKPQRAMIPIAAQEQLVVELYSK